MGTIITFRVGPSDIDVLTKELSPVFDEQDLVNLDKYHIYVKMAIDGVTSPAFSGITLPPYATNFQSREAILEKSRRKFSQAKALVENKIIEWNEKESLPPASLLAKSAQEKEEKAQKPEIKQFEKIGDKEYRRFKDSAEKGWYVEVENLPIAKDQEKLTTDSSILEKILKK